MCINEKSKSRRKDLEIEKVLYYSELNSADSKYIDRLAENLPIVWKDIINYPYDQGDLSVNIRNQYASKLDLKYLSKQYKDALMNTAKIILGEEKAASLKKVMKAIEKNTKFSA